MGQAKRRGTREDRIAQAVAWDEAHREDRRRFPPPPPPRTKPGKDWSAVATLLALTATHRR